MDIGIKNKLKLTDQFNKVIIPRLNLKNEEVEDVRFEFITSGLVFGKVLGKKAYKINVPNIAENSILNSKIVTNKVIVNGKEYSVNWPNFEFVNPDKVTVYIRELLKKSRNGCKGKSFRNVFWGWDGSVTLRVIVKTRCGKVGYYDLLRVIFVYKGNASAGLAWANERRREYKKRIKAILNYIRVLYGNEVADAVSGGYVNHIVNNVKNVKVRRLLLKKVDIIKRLREEMNEVAKLMNRNSGSRFIVIVEYDMYNSSNSITRFYTLTKEATVKTEDRWVDEFGHQKFILVNKEEKVEKLAGIKLETEVFRDVVKKEFKPFGRRGRLNHKIVAQAIPPKELFVNSKEEANVRWLRDNVKVKRSRLFVNVYNGVDTGNKEWIVYVVTGVGNNTARLVVHNWDHRAEGKDRILVHLHNNKKFVFAHML